MKIFLIPGLLVAGACTALAQPNYCMQETVVGTYAVAAQGTVLTTVNGTAAAVPAASLGVIAIDSEGAMFSTSYNSFGGQIVQQQMFGTIKVNSDCTAKIDWGQGLTATVLILDEGKNLSSMGLTAGSMGNAVVTGDWRRISRIPNTVVSQQCAPNAISGVYAFRSTGIVIMKPSGSAQAAPAPVAMLGMGSADFSGNSTATAMASFGGQVMPLSITGATTVKVNPDCTGLMTWNLKSQGADLGKNQHFMVVLDGGNLAWGLEISNPNGPSAMLATWERVSPIPAVVK